MAVARILLGVTGGIAAYKACELLRVLVRAGHEVVPLVTPGAERFVTAETFNALARRPAAEDLYPHLTRADALVIAPLTANTLAKLAHGLADNVLTEAALAHRGPFLVAPAMNTRMWEHPATQANLEVIRARGVQIVGPEVGELAEGETGPGRMSEPEQIAGAVEAALVPPSSALAGANVLVTAGGTREPLDAVRYLGNRSSGRMGVALAAEAKRRGAKVTLLAANLAVGAPAGVEVVETPTSSELERETRARAAGADVVLMAAAVADYRPETPVEGKRAKGETWHLTLTPTVDILQRLGEEKRPRRSARSESAPADSDHAQRNGQVLVGFGAEIGATGRERKRAMLDSKNLDLVVYNDVADAGIGFDAADNEVVLMTRKGEQEVPKAPKARIAAVVLDEVERLLEERRGS